MTATHDVNPTIPTTPVRYLSVELGQRTWKLAITVGLGQKPRLGTITARDTEALMAEIGVAEEAVWPPRECPVSPDLPPKPHAGGRDWTSKALHGAPAACSNDPASRLEFHCALGLELRRHHKERRMTQADLAAKAGLSVPMVRRSGNRSGS